MIVTERIMRKTKKQKKSEAIQPKGNSVNVRGPNIAIYTPPPLL